MTTTMVTWVQADGTTHVTRIFTSHLAAFTQDVLTSGGEVMEFHTESE